MRFNPPPSWPVEPDWAPPTGWQPPQDWEQPPYGWQLWVPDAPQAESPNPSLPPGAGIEVLDEDDAEVETDDRSRSQERPQSLFSRATQNPIWTTLGALVGIIGLVLSSVQVYQAIRTPPVDLEIVALSLDSQQSVQGTLPGGNSQSVEVTPIDITLQNKGGEPSLITKIEAEVVYFQQLQDCTFSAPSRESITTKYDLKIPMDGVKPTTTDIAREIRFEVKAGVADRMVLTLGPQTQQAFATAPMVMTAKLTMIHDDNQVLEVRGVSLVTTVGAANAQIEAVGVDDPSPQTRACAQANLEHLNTMYAIQANRSRALDSLRSAYQRASA
ncbi:MAG: hypothetical protein WDA07_12435 [Leucobacter sp.]